MASVLPVVTVKDPLTWMPSICRHPYAVRLSSKQRTKCPRPLDAPVSVAFKRDKVLYYASLVDLWSTVWKSTNEPFVSLNAIEQTQEWRQPRVEGVESTRHRADAVTGTTSRRWRGASEI